ncbi:MAG: hypothetical protein RL095_951 [Verrucomicrobiota bacterium]|jgi:preprotein translocase subunit YajC
MTHTLLAQGGGGSPLGMFVIFIFMFGFMYLLVIRPQNKKMEEHRKSVAALKKDARVILEGGIYGTIEAVEEGKFQVKIAERTVVTVDQSAIRAILANTEAAKA